MATLSRFGDSELVHDTGGWPMSSSQDRSRLLDLLLTHSVLRGDFTLASGAKSNVYVDCRLTTLRGEAMPHVGRLLLHAFAERDWHPEAVGGLTTGADPVACAVARESSGTGRPLCAFVVRKAEKGHGLKRFVEGLARPEGVPCVVVDDVCTTGGSTAQAVRRVRDAGMTVLGTCCVVDREQGARETLADLGCDFFALFTMRELLARG